MNANSTKYVTKILPSGATALSIAGISADTMKLASYMNINSTKYVVRIFPVGATALSVASIWADTMKFGLVYEYKQ